MKKLIPVVLGLGISLASHAQDPHFSQYYASQSTVNPASTGMFNGSVRVSGLYRQQWPQYGSPFVTGTVAAEFKPRGFRDDNNNDRLSYGVMFLYDKSPNQVLKSQHAYAMVAYHKALDVDGINRIGLGVMGGYNQRTLDASHLTFGTQYNGSVFDPNQAGDIFATNQQKTWDVHTGLMFSHDEENKLFYAGASVYHLLRPASYYISNNNILSSTPMRFNANAGINIRPNNLYFAASVLFMQQQEVREIMGGGMVGVPIADESGVLYAGAFYRINESVIPTINLQWQTFNLGFSYDAWFSSSKTMVKPGSYEVSLSYRVLPPKDLKMGCYAF